MFCIRYKTRFSNRDFNEILSANEKQGGEPRSEWQMANFREVLDDRRLRDLGFKGLNSHGAIEEMNRIGYMLDSATNPWVELTLENWLAREGCPRAYKNMVKLTLNQSGTIGL